MNPAAILSYYPTYNILDEIIGYKNYKNLNLFIDLKNNYQAIYMEHVILNLINSTKITKRIDYSIFESVISFINFHKIFALKRNIDINFYIFFEMGISYYHKKIYKNYKIRREIDDLYGLDKENKQLFSDILQKNLFLIEKFFSLVPNTYVIKLENLEADFIPYYLIKNNIVNTNDDTAQIIYSSDHDMMQCLSLNSNIYQYRKIKKNKYIVDNNNVMNYVLKNNENKIDPLYIPLIMSILGDKGDDIPKISGITEKSIISIIPELDNIISCQQIYNRVIKNSPIFENEFDEYVKIIENKKLLKIIKEEKDNNFISRNLKLLYFELISNIVSNPTSTEMLDRQKIIYNCIYNKKNITLSVAKEALLKSKIFIEEEMLDNLFFDKQRYLDEQEKIKNNI